MQLKVEVAVEDKLDVATMDEVHISSTIVTRKEKSKQENVEEAIQAQGTINLKPDAITFRGLVTALQNVDSPRIELRRILTMWIKKKKSLK